MKLRIRLPLTAALVAAVGLAGCSGAQEWHPVTADEAQQLAITRFKNFDIGTRGFSTDADVDGTQLKIEGWYDFTEHLGYAQVTGPTFDPQVLLWDQHVVALRAQTPDPDGAPVLPVPEPAEQGWQPRELDPTASTLDALLASFVIIGSDRPDNPLLFQQSGALWLEETTHEPSGVQVTVFATPASDDVLGPDDPAPSPEEATAHLWVDDDGVTRRMSLLFPAGWTDVDFDDPGGTAPDLEGSDGSPAAVLDSFYGGGE